MTPAETSQNQPQSRALKAPKTPLPRYRRAPQCSDRFLMQPRDLALLDDLWRYRCLTASQLEILRAADPDPGLRFVSRLTLTRRLKLLFHHGHVARIARPLAAGSLEPIYLLDHAGARELSRRLEGDPEGEAEDEGYATIKAQSPSQRPKSAALEHLLAIAQMRVCLVAACAARDDLQLVEWRGGEAVKFRYEVEKAGNEQRRKSGQNQTRTRQATLIPDGFALLAQRRLDGQRARLPCYVEVDLGTEPSRVLADKARAYLAYWQSGGFAQRFGVSPHTRFRVLLVAPTPKRASTILSAVQALSHGQEMFRVALQSDITPGRVLEAVWNCAGRAQPSALVLARQT